MTHKLTSITWRKVFVFSATFFCIGLLTLSCKKKETTLGAEAYDPNGLLNSISTDTFQLKTYTVESDSVSTKNPQFALLGSYNDPVYGKVDASFYSQLRLQALNPTFIKEGEAFTIDSVVLGLEYRIVNDLDFKGYYGKTTAQKFEVYRVTEALSNDSSYYRTTHLAIGSEDLVDPSGASITPKPTTKTIVGQDTVNALLRIPLKTSFGQDLVDESVNNPTSYSSNTEFLNYLKGIYVKVNNGSQSSGEGGVFNFNLTAARSKMTIYFKQGENAFAYDYIINNNCVRFNHLDIDNSGTNVQQVIDNPSAGLQTFYAQANRSRAAIEIPGLSNLPKNCIIHSARLELPVAYQTGKIYYPSEVIYAAIKPTLDSEKFASMGVLGTSGDVFGIFDDKLKSYTIDVRNYIQLVVNGNVPNRGIFISSALFNASVERMLFNGPNTLNKKKPKLHIVYTTF